MFSLFKVDFKRKFKSSAMWVLIVIMIILFYSYLERGFEKSRLEAMSSEIRDGNMEEYYSSKKSDLYGKSYEEYIEMSPMAGISESYYDLKVSIYEQEREAFFEGNERKILKLEIFSDLLYINLLAHSSSGQNALFVDEICKRVNEELWDKVSGGIKYEAIDFTNTMSVSSNLAEILADITEKVFKVKYGYYLYTHDLNYIPTRDFTNLGGIYDLLINILPTIIVILCILLNYNSINKEVTDGSVKLILTQSTPRWKYYISKYFNGVIITLLVALIPMLITNLFLGTQIGFESMDYPVIYDKQGIKRFKPAFNFIGSTTDDDILDYTSFFKMPHRESFGYIKFYQRNIDIIPFYKFILLSLFFTLLFIMFLVAFVQLFSALINNKILSLIATTSIFVISYYIFKPFLYEEHYNLCPFTMNNGARIVAGTHNVTMLTAFIVLTLSTVIFLLLGIRYFSKKEI